MTMKTEILMIGTELLLGQIVDTNASFMGQVLAENGIDLFQKTTVGDNAERIRNALDAALGRSDAVLTSGGLGPTEDGITRECIAELLGRPLEFRQEAYDALAARFKRFGYTMTENNRKQAYAPQGALIVENPNGTAPGLIVEDPRGVIVCMPGVPRELKPMLTERVVPYLRRKFAIEGLIHSRVLRVCGMGESRVDSAIGDLIVSQDNPTLGLLASPDGVRIRITAKAGSVEEANVLIDEVDRKVRERLPGLVLAGEGVALEQAVDALLCSRGWKLALAETCTGGRMAQRFTAIHAASFAGGYVAPRDQWQSGDPVQTALDFAEHTKASFGSECALGVVADAEAERTAAAFVTEEGARHWEFGYFGAGERGQVRMSTLALEQVRRHLAGLDEAAP